MWKILFTLVLLCLLALMTAGLFLYRKYKPGTFPVIYVHFCRYFMQYTIMRLFFLFHMHLCICIAVYKEVSTGKASPHWSYHFIACLFIYKPINLQCAAHFQMIHKKVCTFFITKTSLMVYIKWYDVCDCYLYILIYCVSAIHLLLIYFSIANMNVELWSEVYIQS